MRAKWFSLAIAATVALFALAYGTSAGSASAPVKPVLTIGELSAPTNVGPAGFDYMNALELLYSGITLPVAPPVPGYDREYGPGLATSWSYLKSSPPNTAFEFTLRHNARFADGTPLTAQAVKTWYEYVAKSSFAVYETSYFGVLKSVSTSGKWTVIVHIKAPIPNIPDGISPGLPYGSPQSPKCVAHPSTLNSGDCGAGPYMVDNAATTPGSKYTFVPNPYYYNKSAQHWRKVVLLVIPTESSIFNALRAGEIQVGQGDASTAQAARAAGFATPFAPDINAGLYFSLAKSKPLRSLKVRQALNYAVDRKALAGVFGGVPSSEVVTFAGYDARYVNYYPYDPSKARALLAAAGYRRGVTLNVVGYGPMGDQGTPQIQAVASQLSKVGITLHVTNAATNGVFANAVKTAAAYQGPYTIDYTTVYYQIFMAGGVSGWNDPVINTLDSKGLVAAPGSSAASSDWKAIMARTVTQAYFLPTLLTNVYLMVNASKVAGVQVRADLNSWAMWEWSPK